METIDVQLFGPPHDGKIVTITAKEMRGSKPIFFPYVPDDGVQHPKLGNDMAMAEYDRVTYGTDKGQLMLWFDPHMPIDAARDAVQSVLSGDRNAKGVWLLQGADMSGNLQIKPLASIQ